MRRARQLANKKYVSKRTLGTMNAWFARHTSTSRKSPNYNDKHSRARQAWLGWGGDAAKKWVKDKLK